MAEGEAPWWAAFPAPKAECGEIAADDVFKLLQDHVPGANRDFLLVDVRRTDWEGGTISTSINLPAHSLYPTRPAVYQLVKQAGVSRVIFYCGKRSSPPHLAHMAYPGAPPPSTGSCNGRGPRAAAWLQDYFDEVGDKDVRAFFLTGGIKGWVRTFGGKLMDAYDETHWAGK